MKIPSAMIAAYAKALLTDDNLKNKLENKFYVFYYTNINQINPTKENLTIKMLLMEIGAIGRKLQLIRKLHIQNPHLRIISIGFDEPKENLILVFNYGSADF